MPFHRRAASLALAATLLPTAPSLTAQDASQSPTSQQLFGFHDPSAELHWDEIFLKVPDAKLAGEHLKVLTASPHWASSPEDYATAKYVADKFKSAGLQTEIVPFKVMLNKPVSIKIQAFDADHHQLMSGPNHEHVDPKQYGGDPFQNDPRILPAFNGSSPSANITAPVVYANYGTREDFDRLEKLGVDVRGKIVLVRYGQNFRGVKVYLAQQHGAAGVLIFSDPADDGYAKGDMYPRGPMRPASGVQRGSVQFLPIYPGDPTTPGVAATPDLPDSKRLTEAQTRQPGGDQPAIPSNPLSYQDAAPILQALNGPVVPHSWQGGLPFTYHLGGTPAVTVHMDLVQDTRLRTIWDVVGTIPGADTTDTTHWVIAGNHRDAWTFGAVDPNSGTAAMLETVHGLGDLLRAGWHPLRTIKICSWDAEEEGLIGSTEWAEQHASELANAVAYFNTDVGVAGPNFDASAVPSLKQFVRDVTMAVPSPKGGTVYEQWQHSQAEESRHTNPFTAPSNAPQSSAPVRVGDLGSGSDYTPFIQHLGVPSTDIGSDGPYGVYHSTFDNYNWFIRNADPTFIYEQQQARVFGLEILRMADANILPYNDETYGREIIAYLAQASREAASAGLQLDFAAADAAAQRFQQAGATILTRQQADTANPSSGSANTLNLALRNAETDLLNTAGLPHRPWYKHTIYAPGEYTGYAAVVIPGVSEGISAHDAQRAQAQLAILAEALNRAANTLDAAAH